MTSPIRTIRSPGYEGREIDMSTRTVLPVGTAVLVMGYTNKGESFEPLNITSTSDLDVSFGSPTNEAERYFYHGCKEIINENGTLVAAKIPYSNVMDVNYKYIEVTLDTSTAELSTVQDAMPEISGALDSLNGSTTIDNFIKIELGDVNNLSREDYDVIAAGGGHTLSDFIIVNERKNKLTGPNNDEGIFITIIDPIHGMLTQRNISDDEYPDNDIMALFNTFNSDNSKIPAGELSGSTFVPNLTATYSGSSVSESMMNYFPPIDFVEDGSQVSNEYGSWLSVIVSSTVANPNNNGELEVSILEAWNGSIINDAKDISNGRSSYIGNIINNNSNYIKWYAKDPITSIGNDKTSLYTPKSTIELVTFSVSDATPTIKGNDVILNVKTILEKVANIDDLQLDIIVDSGLSTIAQYCTAAAGEEFKPSISNSDSSFTEIDSASNLTYWRGLVNELDNFCKNIRKDCMAVVDGPRNLVIEGEQKFVRKTAPTNTFSNTIGKRLKYMTGINSSYIAIYTNWVRVLDLHSGNNAWLPPSIKASGIYVRTDTTASYWDAPAGLNRGIIGGVNDISFNPRVKEADQLYIKSFNYAKQYPLDGFILEGQKTSQVKPSAFDRVNVRRLFLRLERAVYLVSRYYIYQPNNEFTRSQLVAAIEPIFQGVKAQGGLYDYRIVCDETNNTPTVIDNNELRIAIALKPVRTAEFILADFIATRTDTSFDEVL